LVFTDNKIALDLRLSASNNHDAPEGRKLLISMEKLNSETKLLMNRAYEDKETRKTAKNLGYIPVVPPKINRKRPLEYDKPKFCEF
jgi:hypothetical protein